MKKQQLILLTGIVLQTVLSGSISAQAVRGSIDLSSVTWFAQLDEEATWRNDELYLPSEVDLAAIPVNPPGSGWEALYKNQAVKTHIPVSIEELFSEGFNSYTYHGVSWLWCEVDVPPEWEGRYISFDVEKARMRIEIYINEQLAGYDIVAETPFSVNVAGHLAYGKKNRIAIRLTNPGGQRGWADFPGIGWGKYKFPASHDFSGVGHISLEAKNRLHVEDIFVKTLPPVKDRTVHIEGTINNRSGSEKKVTLQLEISSLADENKIYSKKWTHHVREGINRINRTIQLKKALLWDIDHPNLYRCELQIVDGGKIDSHAVRFGIRTFEVKERGGNPTFYLNDRRIRFRSAIDWGYYAFTGFYAPEDQARASVDAAKAIGHNMISFHRRIGEPAVMDYADKAGLYLYEEPGGFRGKGQGDGIPEGTFSAKFMLEKVRRMVLRDRNHPSLVWYTLCNEDNSFNLVRKEALMMVNSLDNSRLVCNSSGWGKIESILPYDSVITNMIVDDHTVEEHLGYLSDGIPGWSEEVSYYEEMLKATEIRDRSIDSESRFRETEFFSHTKKNDSCITFWGEVRCFTGPPNWYKAAEMQKDKNYSGYDMNIYKPMRDGLDSLFNSHDFPNTGSKNIQSPADLSVQAGRGLMYIDGRMEQIIMADDLNDGFAINGWTSGPQLPLIWESAILDEAHNLKGPAEDYNFWNRPNQIAIFRQNGKYFNTGDTVIFRINLINEGILEQGNYQLGLSVTDGSGNNVLDFPAKTVFVEGGEVYAQTFVEEFALITEQSWKAGHITLHAQLMQDGKLFSAGTEQVLLKNRLSYHSDLKDKTGMVFNWNAARHAIEDAGVHIEDYAPGKDSVEYILAGTVMRTDGRHYYGPVRTNPTPSFLLNEEQSADILRRVKEEGTTLIIKLDHKWATWLFEHGVISAVPVAFANDNIIQTKFWDGNGWGYIDYFCGDQSIPSKSTIGTTSWEPATDPAGFYPFESDHPTKVYGAYFENGGKIRVLIGTVQYGKGTIILNRTYPVDYDHAFNDLIFFNMIRSGNGYALQD